MRVLGNPSEKLLTDLSLLGWEHINAEGCFNRDKANFRFRL